MIALGSVWLLPATAVAQGEPARWLLLPAVVEGSAAELDPVVAELARELRDRDVYPLAFDEAKALFRARASSEPATASESDLDVVAREAQQALQAVATGRNLRAQQSVARVLERAERALESLNRQADSARHVLNSCLYLVRAMLDSGNREAATSRALECRRLVPDIEADPHDHPPAVLELLREVETQLATGATGRLRVLSRPSGCQVIVNGRALGTTPYEMGEVPPGEYRVQVECEDGTPGRVHRVILAAESTLLRIDTRFDAAVSTQEGLRLAYRTERARRRHRYWDGLAAGRIVGASHVLFVTPAAGGQAMQLDLARVRDASVVASARLPVPSDASTLRRHVAAAIAAIGDEGRSVDVRTGKRMGTYEPPTAPEETWVDVSPDAITAAEGTPSTSGDGSAGTRGGHPRRSGGPPTVAGFVLGGAGVAALVTTWVLWAELQSRNDFFALAFTDDPDYLHRQDRVDRMELAVFGTGAAGGVLTTVAMPLLLPRREGVPWWSWAAAGVGAVVAGFGIAGLATGRVPGVLEDDAIDMGATRRQQTDALGVALIAHAAPLLSMPFVYLLRGATSDEGARASLALSPHGATLSLGGIF